MTTREPASLPRASLRIAIGAAALAAILALASCAGAARPAAPEGALEPARPEAAAAKPAAPASAEAARVAGLEAASAQLGKGDAAANNVFTGTITVTVIEVLPNGNLLVSGEKQVAIGHGQEYIRLSGIVNPYFVNASNTIASSQVADARIEYPACR